MATERVIGNVHSAFRKVLNISTPHGRLISVSCQGVPMLTSNIETSQPFEQGFPAAFVNGTEVCRSGDSLYLDGLTVSGLSLARPFAPRNWAELRLATTVQVKHALARTADQAIDIVGTRGLAVLIPALRNGPPLALGNVHFDTPFDGSIAQHLSRLAKELYGGEEPLTSRQLIGLGPGLTPSGDDVLAGLITSLHATCRAHGRLPSYNLQALTRIATEGKGKTTLISYEMLRHAARGHMTEAAESVIAGVLQGEDCRTALALMAQYGATSGLDQLIGILLGIQLFYCLDESQLATNVD